MGKTTNWSDLYVNMYPVEGSVPTAGWWANYLLELGEKADYATLIIHLDEAKAKGCLSIIRMATQDIVRARVKERMRQAAGPSVKKARRKSGTFKAAA